jgi:uncharacterized protein (DUF2236 family)
MLRGTAALLAVCLLGAIANDYMDLGWFGQHARLVDDLMCILMTVFLAVATRMWQRDS